MVQEKTISPDVEAVALTASCTFSLDKKILLYSNPEPFASPHFNPFFGNPNIAAGAELWFVTESMKSADHCHCHLDDLGFIVVTTARVFIANSAACQPFVVLFTSPRSSLSLASLQPETKVLYFQPRQYLLFARSDRRNESLQQHSIVPIIQFALSVLPFCCFIRYLPLATRLQNLFIPATPGFYVVSPLGLPCDSP